MKRAIITSLALVFAAIAGFAMYVPVAEAQQYTTSRPGGRAGNWEFSLPLIYSNSANIDGEGGSRVHLNRDWGFGFGFGYNFTDSVQLNGLWSWSSRSYDATVVRPGGSTEQYSSYMDSSTLSLNGNYYFMDGQFSPFVSLGIGYTFIDTNIQNAPASGSCWYDPWWGYVCSSYVPTKTEDDWSYNAGLGVRYEVNRQFAMQLGYYKMWIDISNASNTPDFDLIRLDLIFRM